jgi:hypothetical protein
MRPTLQAQPEGCLSDLALDRMVAGEPSPATAREHLATCERCRTRLDRISRERDVFLASESTSSIRTALGRRERRHRWAIGTASCGAIAIAAAVLLWFYTKPNLDEVATSTRLKGAPHLGFYVKHDEIVTLGANGERVHPGDSLRFVYTSGEPRYIAILSFDGARHASVYYPSGASRAERAPAAVDRPLESSTVLDETLGNESLYGIFCIEPILLEPMRAALEKTGALPVVGGCTVDMLEIRKEASATP